MLKKAIRAINLSYKQCGMALPLVLIFTAILLAFGSALLNYSMSDKLISGYHSQDVAKYYLAESGLEAGYAILQKNFYHKGTISGSLDKGSFTVSFIDTGPERRIIASEGKIEEYSLTLKMLVENDPENGLVIIEWLGE